MYLNHSILFQVPAPLCCRTRFKEFNFSLLFHRVNYPPKDKSFSQSPTASDHVQGCPLKFTLPLLPVPLDPLQLFKAHPKGEDSKAQPPEFSAGLKKYYAHRFMLCKKTHLLAEGARSTSWTWCEKPQWETPWQTPDPKTEAPEGTSAAALLQETTSPQYPYPRAPGTLELAFLIFLSASSLPDARKLGLHSLLVQTCCLLSQHLPLWKTDSI